MSSVSLILASVLSLQLTQLWQEKPKSAPAVVGLPDFRPLVKEALPAVVNITVETRVRAGHGGVNPFEQFFGPMAPRLPREYRNKGVGSGFVISTDGYVLTNYHVVENADTIKVKFPDDFSTEEYPAKVIGSDARTDVALIKIQANRTFTAVPLGDSTALQVGEWVVAIGNPFGLQSSVSAGIVSAKDRREVEPSGRAGLYDFIQTDASINPGNSGGPLLNLRGEVVGINAAVNAAGQGLGFAIPINMVKSELADLKSKGRASRSWMGVGLQSLSPELARSYKLEKTQGAVIAQVVEGSPAAKAGMQPGDVILDFDGRSVRDHNDVRLWAAEAGVKKTITLLILRDGKRVKTSVTLAESPRDQDSQGVSADDGDDKSDNDDRAGSGLGLRVSDLTADLRERIGTKEKTGAVVVDLDPSGAAAEAGLRGGDIIVKVNDAAITNAKDVTKIVRATKSGDVLRVLVRRGVGTVFVALVKP